MTSDDISEIIVNSEPSLNSKFDNHPDTIDYPNKFTAFVQKYKIKNQLAKEFLAELLGTTILVLTGLASGAQSKFLSKENPTTIDFISPHLAGGLGVSMAIFLVGKVSGAHLNPAVSFGMLLTSRIKFKKFLVYLAAQFLGAFFGAIVVFLLYYSALDNYEIMRSIETAEIFVTFPHKDIGILTCIFDQIVGTGFLVMVILALTDKRNNDLPHGVIAISVGLTLFIIGSSLGYNCGAPLNPARDLSPRIFILIAGWGNQAFTNSGLYFLASLFGPMIGAFFAAVFYMLMISNHF